MKRFLTLLVLFALLCSMSVHGFAGGKVTYDGTAQKFIFSSGSDDNPENLFPDFQNVMPGDSITHKITIRNDASNEVKIRLYIRATGAQEGSEAFLSQLNLCVTQDGDSIYFDAPADQTAQLTEWTYLGTFYSGAEIDLNVTLDVPITLGNEFQDAVGYLDWEFKVEELPIDPDDPPPPTGDRKLIKLAGMSAAAAAALLLIVVLRRRSKKQTAK